MPDEQMPPQDPQAQSQSVDASGGDPLTQMITQTDEALTQIAQVLSKASPEAGQALIQINEQFRQVIQQVLSQAEGGGQQQQASEMVSPETHGKPSMMAY